MDPLFSYVENTIFDNNNVNFVIDKILTFLTKEFGRIEQSIILSGRASAFLQEETTEVPNQVILITNHTALFEYLTKIPLSSIDCTGTVFFKNRLLFYFSDFYLEIWFTDEIGLEVVWESNIACQNYSQIPEILL